MDDLLLAVESLFSDETLFDPYRTTWRMKVAPSQTETPLVSLQGVLHLLPQELQTVGSVEDVAECLKKSPILRVERKEDGTWYVARVHPLLEKNNPSHRTIFAKPIHFQATDSDIAAFFSVFGAVEKVSRSSLFEVSSGQEKKRLFCSIQFSTVEAAAACLKHPPSYGTLSPVGSIGQHFVPVLSVFSHKEFTARQAETADAALLRTVV